jgi:hypothetical protein
VAGLRCKLRQTEHLGISNKGGRTKVPSALIAEGRVGVTKEATLISPSRRGRRAKSNACH